VMNFQNVDASALSATEGVNLIGSSSANTIIGGLGNDVIDGAGGADPLGGSGLAGLKDRIEALGGTFSVHSPAGGGTTMSCELPVVTGTALPSAL